MPFATRADLLARTNARRLAQLAVPADAAMPPDEALRVVIAGGRLNQFTQVDQDSITLALETIDRVLADADAVIVSYGIPATLQTPLLARMSSTIALYYLQGTERMTDEVQSAYKSVIDMLNKHTQGMINLIPADPATPAIVGDVITITSNSTRYGSNAPEEDW